MTVLDNIAIAIAIMLQQGITACGIETNVSVSLLYEHLPISCNRALPLAVLKQSCGNLELVRNITHVATGHYRLRYGK